MKEKKEAAALQGCIEQLSEIRDLAGALALLKEDSSNRMTEMQIDSLAEEIQKTLAREIGGRQDEGSVEESYSES